jgi:hypothetical protein
MHVMVDGPHGGAPARHAAPRKFADFHLGLGVQRDAERLRILRGLGVDLPQVLEDGVGLGNLF